MKKLIIYFCGDPIEIKDEENIDYFLAEIKIGSPEIKLDDPVCYLKTEFISGYRISYTGPATIEDIKFNNETPTKD